MTKLSTDHTFQLHFIASVVRRLPSTLLAVVTAIAVFGGAPRCHAFSLTWTTGNDVWTSPTAWTTNATTGTDPLGLTNVNCAVFPLTNVTAVCAGGTGSFPATGDLALFTNSLAPFVTVNITTNVRSIEVSNSLVSFNAGVNTLTVTGQFRVGSQNFTTPATSTVYWGGGTLAVTNGGSANVQIGTGTNALGILVVTNGALVFDQNFPSSSTDIGMSLGGPVSAGRLIISGNGVVTNRVGGNGTLNMTGSATVQSQIIITNGGKLFVDGNTQCKSNGLILVSGAGSILSNSLNVGSSVVSIGVNNNTAPGSTLIVTNGGTVWSEGTISFGRGSSYNTGYVSGAGSRLISDTSGGFVLGITGGATNALVVSNGGYIRSGGLFQVPDGSPCPGNVFQMGGAGAVSTGQLTSVRQNSGSQLSSIIVTNAILTCGMLELQGGPSNQLQVLAGGTLIFSNQYAVSLTTTNVLISESITGPNIITINAGTVNAVSGSNAMQIVLGASGETGPNIMIVTNSGKLLSEQAEIGINSSYSTGVVTGVGTVWSNFTAGVSYAGSNEIDIGTGSTLPGSFNYLSVQNGALLVNNGDFLIANSGSSTLNAAYFGGPGALAQVVNIGSLTVGASSGSSGNMLTISNATVFAGLVKVRPTNTLVFAAGTLTAQSMDTDPGANNSNEFVVGDGIDAAFYDMAAGGDGYHRFGAPGLVVTNGASLRGSGTITGTTTILGTLVPGFAGSVGTIFTSNSVTLGNSAVLNYDIGFTSDSVSVGANLALGGTLNVADSGGLAAGDYTIFTYAGTLSPGGTLTVGSMPGGFTGSINTNTTGFVLLHVTGSGSGDPYTSWKTHYFPGGGPSSLGGADPDGDGVSNTNEFLAGFSPTNSSAFPHVISIVRTSSNVRVTYLGANGDNTWSPGIASRTNVLEYSAGTANGSYTTNNFVSTGQTNILSGGTGVGVVTNMVDINGATNSPSRYYRIRVLAP